ncbi:MAG: bile acid:sodium symporter family protein [Pseudomonadota bacterium]
MVGQFEQIASAIIVFLVMLGMGASLTPRDFAEAARRPAAPAIGLACQFGIMPLLGFLLITALPMSDAIAVGVLIMACMPGGTTSNMFTYFARGNLALSVLMTVASTVLGVVAIPVILSVYASALDLVIPTSTILATLAMLLVPVGLGLAIRRWSVTAGERTERIGSALGVVFIVFLIGSWVPRNWQFLLDTAPSTYVAAVALGVVGIVLGTAAARALRLDERDARTVGIETGLQNGPLAFGIIAFTFSGEQQQAYMAVPALYSVVIVVIASVVTLHFRRRTTAHTASALAR